MRREVMITLLLAELAMAIWITIDSGAPLHEMANDYSGKGILEQSAFAGCLICFSFGIGKMFRK